MLRKLFSYIVFGLGLALFTTVQAAHISYFSVAPSLASIEVDHLDLAAWSDVFPVRGAVGRQIVIEWNQDSELTAASLNLSTSNIFVSTERMWIISHLHEAPDLNIYDWHDVLVDDGDTVLIEATEAQAFALVDMGVHIEELRNVMWAQKQAQHIQMNMSFNSDIQDMVDQVSSSNIDQTVADLVAFGNRKANSSGGVAAQNWIFDMYASLGIGDVQLKDISGYSSLHDNVIAIYPGIENPDEIVIIGGHYDSILGSSYGSNTDIPGADDNASGTAGVLEVARILSQYDFKRTIVFAAYGAEEYGLRGSRSHAAELKASGANVVGMVNLDMIGHLRSGDRLDLDIISDSRSQDLQGVAESSIDQYVSELPYINGSLPPGASSDHASFWGEQYPAIFFFEDSNAHSNMIHTPNDDIGTSYNSSELAELITKAAVATIATLAEPIEVNTDSGNDDDDSDDSSDNDDDEETFSGESPSIASGFKMEACQQQSQHSSFFMLILTILSLSLIRKIKLH